MSDDNDDYEREIKNDIDREFGGPSEYWSDPRMLIGRWTFAFRDGPSGVQEFSANGTSRNWLNNGNEAEATADQWTLRSNGWLSVSREYNGIWYPDVWRLYRFDDNRFVLANEDASIKLEHKRVAAADP